MEVNRQSMVSGSTMRLDLFSPGDSVLLLGEGNFSFACGLMRHRLPIFMVATCFEREMGLEGQADHIKELEDNEVPVYLDVGATRIHEHRDIAAHKYSKVVFNFPHIAGKNKRHTIQEHRDLLLEMFRSARRVVREDGQMIVSLCRGQGGTELEWEHTPYEKSWQIAEMGAHGDFIIVSVEPYVKENFPDYKCHDADFSLKGALVHVFSKCISVFPDDIDDNVVEQQLEMATIDLGANTVGMPNFLCDMYQRNPLNLHKSPYTFFKEHIVRELCSYDSTKKPIKVVNDEDIPIGVLSEKGVPCEDRDEAKSVDGLKMGEGVNGNEAEEEEESEEEESEEEESEEEEEEEEEESDEEEADDEGSGDENKEKKEEETKVKKGKPKKEETPEPPENPTKLRMAPTQILNEALTVWEEFHTDGYIFHPGIYFSDLTTKNFLDASPVSNQFLLIGRGASMLCYRFLSHVLHKVFFREGVSTLLRPRNTKGDKMPHPRDTVEKTQPETDIFKWHVGLEWVYSTVDQSTPDCVPCHIFSLLYKGSVVDAAIIFPDKLIEFFFGNYTWRQLWSENIQVKKFKKAPPEVVLRKPGLNPPVFEFEAKIHLGEKKFDKDKIYRTLWLAAGHIISQADKLSDSGIVTMVIKYHSVDIPLYRKRVQDIHQKIVCKMLAKVLRCTVGS